MINFHNLTGGEFARLGFTFETPEETELFASVIQEELEVRIGHTIGKKLTDAQMKEFDHFHDQKESSLWLERNCPDYREIVQEEQVRLEDELRKYRAEIPGAIPFLTLKVRELTIEELILGVRSFNCLKRAGLNTVEDIINHGNLSQIKNLGQRGIEEINAKLWMLAGVPQ